MSSRAYTFARLPLLYDCFLFALTYRAMVDKNPRKLQWKTPTYGPLVRPYHPYKEVRTSFSEIAGGLQQIARWALHVLRRRIWFMLLFLSG